MARPRTTVVGVSLKMYFGQAQTLAWCAAVAHRAAAQRTADLELFVLPSFPALPAVADALAPAGIGWGAQDLAASDAGAQTGEVGGAVLAELGCRYVEVGHAERRALFGEDASVVAAKTAAALRHGLTPVLCVGEPEHGSVETAAAECVRQLELALGTSVNGEGAGRVLVAYEPHWAIGAAEPASEEHIAGVCGVLRRRLAELPGHEDSAVIYGGSAGPGLLTRLAGAVDGLFLGRFAHDPDAYAAVLAEAAQLASTSRAEVSA